MRAGIALGSNLGDRLGTLREARRRIAAWPDFTPPLLASAIYETAPVDCEKGAGKFLNAVIEIGYGGGPEELLRRLREMEAALGRAPRHARNASRTLDLDLLYFGDLVRATAELELPHPRMRGRQFVLEPLAEIRPDLVLLGGSETVAALRAKLPVASPLLRIASEW